MIVRCSSANASANSFTNPSPPQGLHNVGSTCWLNALLQALTSLPALGQELLRLDRHGTPIHADKLTSAYVNLLAGRADSPAQILDALGTWMRGQKKASLLEYKQECADEAFTMMVDALGVSELFANAYQLTTVCPVCGEINVGARDNSIAIPYYATYGRSRTVADFSEHLRRHRSECDSFTCAVCRRTSTRVARTETLKKIKELCVLVNSARFGDEPPNTDAPWYPCELIFPSRTGGDLHYILVATVEHVGTRSSGHYTARVLRGSQWYLCNDANVTPIANADPRAETFMVMYALASS